MTLTLITPPAVAPVTLTEAKAHARIDASDDDALIGDLIDAAAGHLDGRDGSLGLALITQTWRLALDHFDPEIAIPLPPCQAVTAVTYLDPTGTTRTLDPAAYQVAGLGSTNGARLRPAYGLAWPDTRDTAEAVAITFRAGFGDTPAAIPEPIRTAIKQTVGHWFEHREAALFGSAAFRETPMGVADLVRNYRAWVF